MKKCKNREMTMMAATIINKGTANIVKMDIKTSFAYYASRLGTGSTVTQYPAVLMTRTAVSRGM